MLIDRIGLYKTLAEAGRWTVQPVPVRPNRPHPRRDLHHSAPHPQASLLPAHAPQSAARSMAAQETSAIWRSNSGHAWPGAKPGAHALSRPL
eukprot:UN04300